MKKSTHKPTKKVEFRLTTEPGSAVFLAGTFNNWEPTANPMKDNPGSGHCVTSLRLPSGRYEYKFVVNGVWCADPNCPEWVRNEHGSINSVITV